MKKIIMAVIIASAFLSVLASGSMKLNKLHKGMNKDGNKINCAYCHTVNKIPKKGNDYKSYQKNAYCQGKGCHGK